MGGEVLELKTDKIIAREKRAVKKGIAQGSDSKTRQFVRNLILRGTPDRDICDLAECDLSLVDEVRQEMEQK